MQAKSVFVDNAQRRLRRRPYGKNVADPARTAGHAEKPSFFRQNLPGFCAEPCRYGRGENAKTAAWLYKERGFSGVAGNRPVASGACRTGGIAQCILQAAPPPCSAMIRGETAPSLLPRSDTRFFAGLRLIRAPPPAKPGIRRRQTGANAAESARLRRSPAKTCRRGQPPRQ